MATGATIQNTVEQIGYDSAGNLTGTWAAGPSMVTPRRGAASVVIGNNLVVISGRDASNTSNSSTETSGIGAGGSLAPFSAGPNLNTSRYGPMAVVIGNYLYVLGGQNGTTAGPVLSSVERAPIGAGGTLGAFQNYPNSMKTARAMAPTLVSGGYLYVLGGWGPSGTAAVATIERAPINPDGSLGPFDYAPGPNLATARYAEPAVALGTSVYLFGGRDSSSNPVSTVDQGTLSGLVSSLIVDKQGAGGSGLGL